jgi:hypothetical protein
MVAKIVRRPRHQERLAAEFELLRFLADRYAGAPIAPHPIALVQHRDHWMLLETALDAKFLRRGRARSHRRTWERVEAWLLDLASTAATVDKAWHDEQIADPLERLEQTLPASEAEEQLFAETRALTLELTRLSVPAPLEHDDLFRTHLGIRRDGSLAAIDWELGRCAVSRRRMQRSSCSTCSAHPQAVSRARRAPVPTENFLHPRGLARQWLEEHLERQNVERRW